MFCMRAFWLHTEKNNLEKVQLNECIIVLNLWEFDLSTCFQKHLKKVVHMFIYGISFTGSQPKHVFD